MKNTLPFLHRAVVAFSFAFAVTLPCAASAGAADVPLSSLTPTQQALNTCFRVDSASVQTPDNQQHKAIRLSCGGIVSYPIPAAVGAFHVGIWRTDVANTYASHVQVPQDFGTANIRVVFSIDGKQVVEIAPDNQATPEVVTIPTNSGHTLSIRMEQATGGSAVYLIDAAFSAQGAASVTSRHILRSGTAYANIGYGGRQVAFHDFIPGETVPIQVEISGKASQAQVRLTFSSLSGGPQPTPVLLNIPLSADGDNSIGSGQWKAPSTTGPFRAGLLVSTGGHPIYSRDTNIAVAKPADLASVQTSNFGVHISGDGEPLLMDDFADLWGAKWGRIFIRWDQVESQQGHYQWQWIDAIVDNYQRQHFDILGVMGEIPPKWMTQPATSVPPAYARFVAAALDHFRGKIQYWDVYNEPDSKYFGNLGFDRNISPNQDIDMLKKEMQQMQQVDPSLVRICCSTGGSEWLQYEKRLYDAGLSNQISIVSMHPYQAGPPEDADNGLSYVETVQRLTSLAASYGTPKPVWSTEANWLIGPPGTPGVSAPNVNEHQQSQYVVRVNLLSLGLHVPYFVHSPFFTGLHKEVLVDSLASYAAMTSIFSDAQNAHLLSLPSGIFGVTASTHAGTIVALWTDSLHPVTVHVSNLSISSMRDMYGNPLPATTDPVLTESPVYLTGTGTPNVTAREVPRLTTQPLPPPSAWKQNGQSHSAAETGGLHVTSVAGKYDTQLLSPTFDVSPNSCYLIKASLVVHQGGIGMTVMDPDSNKVLRSEFMYPTKGNDSYTPTVRVITTNDRHMQVLITDANSAGPAISDFHFSGAQFGPCP